MTVRALTLRCALPALLLLGPAVASAAECPDAADITIQEAPACIGQFRRIVGKVENVGKGKSGVTFINFCKDFRKCPFVAVVFPKRVGAFPPVETLVGETVEVSGQIATYQSQSQVVLEDASQLIVRGSQAVRPPKERAPAPRETVPEPKPAPREPPRAEIDVTRPIAPLGDEAPEPRPKPRARVWPDDGPEVTVETVPTGAAPMRNDATIVAPRSTPRPEPRAESRPSIARGEPSPNDPKPLPASPPVASPPSTQAVSIAAQDAVKYVGKRVRVKGKVTQVTFEGNDLVARMSKGGGSVLFAAVVPGDKVEALAAAVEGWDGQVVEYEGEIVLYSGVPAVFIRSETQVTKH